MMYEQQQLVRMNNMRNSKRQLRRSRTGIEEDYHDTNHNNKLEIVDLSGMSLDSLPLPPINLAAISKLDLSNNNLQSIPESLTARLLNVIILDVHSNQLKSLPNSIGCLTKLKVLNVSGNLIQSLPRTIENCSFPPSLHLPPDQPPRPGRPSQLPPVLPSDLENLINLEILNISQNFQYLATLPYSIGLLISLVELDVSYNKITALPESIGCLKKLQKLSVEGNPLVSPPMEVIEQGVDMVKEYLCGKINGTHKRSPKKNSWFGKLAKCGTFNGANLPIDDREGYIMPSYRTIDGLASPRYMGMFSPRRLFSPKSYFSR
ncbi:hypothetical protein DH2020_026468 [Rehmannia glutinosa]|uniref:Plant intracellular Ras-group-related LRR protein 6-like n=1 Tax=Rehmannia glutinosa TaxID=99300 RepID=A0ABR0VXR2_REHGL